MPFSETQLTTWEGLGSVTQSAATYKTIKDVLNSQGSPYYPKTFDIFLQGSYGNDTNVYADSDVDIVINLHSAFNHNISELSEASRNAFHSAFDSASYGYSDFKKEVLSWLIDNYGKAVDPGSKAITIHKGGGRREADVLVAQNYRKYTNFASSSNYHYIEGICFWSKDGTKIINYPKQHSENVTSKHQATNQWFKRTVRVFKNMRNRMTDSKKIRYGLAPSYFIEGLLYNVPAQRFGGTRVQNFVDVLTWLTAADRSEFVCANEQYFLCHPSDPVCWRYEDSQAFLDALVKFWNAG